MKRAFVFLLALLLSLSPLACAEDAYIKRSKSFFGTFDTIVVIMGYTADEKTFDRAFDGAQERMHRYHEVYDAYSPHGEVKGLYYLNEHGPSGEPVSVEQELMDLLLYCREHQPLLEDRFNIAMGSVLALWHDAREEAETDPENASLPSIEALRAAAEHTNLSDVLLDEAAGTVTFADPLLRIDLGAVAKGYATEQVAQWLLEGEMPSFLISAGGNVRAGEPPMDGRLRWGISIQDPEGAILSGANEDILDVLFLVNGSVVTSGDYQRYFSIDGKRYHHLIDPDTLMPGEKVRSVTVVCEDSGWADMLSTTLFLMPYAEGSVFVESLDGVEAYWMLLDGSLAMTDGMRALARSEGATSK